MRRFFRFLTVVTVAIAGTIFILWLADDWQEVMRIMGFKH